MEIDALDSYFCYLGIANKERNEGNELIFKLNYGKVSELELSKIKLEELVN